MLVIGANVRFEKRRSSCLSSRIVEETCCPRSLFVCEVSVGTRSGGGGGREDTGGQVASSAGGAAMFARSGASSSSFDSFYY